MWCLPCCPQMNLPMPFRQWAGRIFLRKQHTPCVPCACRCRKAASALRGFKSEAREAGKLLEDKKALETKLKEVQATLELVQGQRNELRQEVKDAKAALAEEARARKVSRGAVKHWQCFRWFSLKV